MSFHTMLLAALALVIAGGTAGSMATPTREVLSTTEIAFDKDVLASELPVAVTFYATWCGACRKFRPIFEETARAYDGKMNFYLVNVDQNRTLAARYEASALPTIVFFKKGEPMQRLRGAHPKSNLDLVIGRLLAQ